MQSAKEKEIVHPLCEGSKSGQSKDDNPGAEQGMSGANIETLQEVDSEGAVQIPKKKRNDRQKNKKMERVSSVSYSSSQSSDLSEDQKTSFDFNGESFMASSGNESSSEEVFCEELQSLIHQNTDLSKTEGGQFSNEEDSFVQKKRKQKRKRRKETGNDAESLNTIHCDKIKSCIISNLPKLVEDIKAHVIMPHLESELGQDEVSTIMAEGNKQRMNSLILDAVRRRIEAGSSTIYDVFCQALAGCHPDLFELLIQRKPTRQESDSSIALFKQGLQEAIKQRGHITDNEMDEKIDLDKNYITLRMTEQTENEYGHTETATKCEEPVVPSRYQAHLSQNTSFNISADQIVNRLEKGDVKLLKGRAGIGKTATMQWLARQWALGKWSSKFSVVFLIPVRRLFTCRQKLTLFELLTNYSLYETPDDATRHVSVEWLLHNQDRVLVLLDGLDEIKSFYATFHDAPCIRSLEKEADAVGLCISLLKKHLLQRSTLICASRGFSGLHIFKSAQIFEILGLTQEGVQSYISNTYPSNEEQIKLALNQNPLMASVCAITFYCTVITKLLSSDATLVDNDIQTYTRLQSFIVQRYASRKLEDSTFILEAQTFLPKLAHLAYNGIFGVKSDMDFTQIIFTEEDAAGSELTREELRKGENMGLICSEMHEHKMKKEYLFQFFHLSVQELLSVCYLINSKGTGSIKRLETDGRLDMMVLYMFGLLYDKDSSWVQKILKASRKPQTTHPDDSNVETIFESYIETLISGLSPVGWMAYHQVLKAVQVAYESQSPKIAMRAAEVAIGSAVRFSDLLLTAVDVMALTFTCRHKEDLTEIYLDNVNLDDKSVEIISEFLGQKNSVTRLYLGSNQVGQKSLKALSEMLSTNSTLLALFLDRNQIEDRDIKYLLPGLKRNVSLRGLSLLNNCIADEGASAIADCITTDHKLNCLDLSHNFIGNEGADSLYKAAMGMAIKPQAWHLLDNNVDDEWARMSRMRQPFIISASAKDPETLKEDILQCSSSVEVNLISAGITDKNFRQIASKLKNHPTMEYLRLDRNKLTWLSLPHLYAIAGTSSKLKSISLRGNALDDHIIDSFKELTFWDNVQRLKIGKYSASKTLTQMDIIGIENEEWWPSFSTKVKKEKLSEISFKALDLQNKGSVYIEKALCHFSLLEHLEFSEMSLIGTWKTISRGIKPLKHLKSLKVTNCDMQTNLDKLISEALENHPMLTILDLARTDIINMAPSNLTKTTVALTNHKALQELNLKESDISLEGIDALSTALLTNTSLAKLDLSVISLWNTGAMYLSRALVRNRVLSNLVLQDCDISHEGAKCLAEALEENQTLTALDLSSNPLGDKGLKYLGKALKHNKTLTSLKLAHGEFGDKGVRYISEGLKFHGTLEKLDLSTECIDLSGFTLKEAVLTVPSLIWIRIPEIRDARLAVDINQAVARNAKLKSKAKKRGGRKM